MIWDAHTKYHGNCAPAFENGRVYWRLSKGEGVKILARDKLPSCFGLRMAQDLMDNEMLKTRFLNAASLQAYKDSLNVIGQAFLSPVVEDQWKKAFELLMKELDRQHGEGASCGECDVRLGCFLTALTLLGDESKWLE